MASSSDIDQFIKDPSLIVVICKKVVEHLYNDSKNIGAEEKEAKLREISRTIERLERSGISIPEALRCEKTRLAVSIGTKSEKLKLLHSLTDGLEIIISDLNIKLGRCKISNNNSKLGITKRSRSPKTDKKVLREHIIKALKKFGGRARVTAVIEEMAHQLDGKLLPGDLEWRKSTNEYAWQNNAKWERFHMTQDGILRKD